MSAGFDAHYGYVRWRGGWWTDSLITEWKSQLGKANQPHRLTIRSNGCWVNTSGWLIAINALQEGQITVFYVCLCVSVDVVFVQTTKHPLGRDERKHFGAILQGPGLRWENENSTCKVYKYGVGSVSRSSPRMSNWKLFCTCLFARWMTVTVFQKLFLLFYRHMYCRSHVPIWCHHPCPSYCL